MHDTLTSSITENYFTDIVEYYLFIENGASMVMDQDGEFFDFTNNFKHNVFCINAPLIIRNAGYSLTQRHNFLFDIAELAIFFFPTSGIMPTLKDLCHFFNINQDLYNIPDLYQALILTILNSFHNFPNNRQKSLIQKIACASQNNWCWGAICLSYFKISFSDAIKYPSYHAILANWEQLSPNEQRKKIIYEDNKPITYNDAVDYLSKSLSEHQKEPRPQQLSYIKELSKVYADDLSDIDSTQNAILCEADTGTGKTLGYLAPAIAWANKNNRPAIISTYSKTLQNQVAAELIKFYPNPQDYDAAVTVRKGRENYLCLKKYQSAILQPNLQDNTILYLVFISNWLELTHHGDVSDIYYPLWLEDFFPNTYLPKLTISVYECTYHRCPFYNKCFAEKHNHKSETNRIIITNHAYLMSKFQNNPLSDEYSGAMVIDEAHHIFAAADNIYNIHLNLKTLSDFKYYILGYKDHIGQLLTHYDDTINLLLYPEFKASLYEEIINLSHIMDLFPNTASESQKNSGAHAAPLETIYHQLFQALEAQLWDYFSHTQEISLEDYTQTSFEDKKEIFQDAYHHLIECKNILLRINYKCQELLNTDIDQESVKRITAFKEFIQQKVTMPIDNFLHIITEFYTLCFNKDSDYIMYCVYDHYNNNYANISLVKRYLNPTEYFGHQILSHVKRLILTSAGLRADTHNKDAGWDFAQQLTGMHYRQEPAFTAHIPSDFDYENNAKIIIINDILNSDQDGYIEAFKKLVLASKGGVLGLFTAIMRLKNCYKKIIAPMRHHNILTLSMHQAIANNQTLIQLFKHDENAVLLGTDLMRDGIDIPGNALRLVVFERIPWQRNNLIYKKRCALFKAYNYDKFLVKQKLKQAFGRLIRSNKDTGCFVLVASRCPSDLLKAFPTDCSIEKLSTNEAIKAIEIFQKSGSA